MPPDAARGNARQDLPQLPHKGGPVLQLQQHRGSWPVQADGPHQTRQQGIHMWLITCHTQTKLPVYVCENIIKQIRSF